MSQAKKLLNFNLVDVKQKCLVFENLHEIPSRTMFRIHSKTNEKFEIFSQIS